MHSVNPWSAVVGVLAAVAFLAGAAAWGVVIGLLVGAVVWLVYVAIRLVRKPAATRVEFTESVGLPHSATAVWGLIEPPENGPLLYPGIRRGYRVPDMPSGVGERHAFELNDGTTRIIEVLDIVPGHRAVIRNVEPRDDPGVHTHEVTETDGGCVYRQSVEVEIAHSQQMRPDYEPEWRQHIRDSFERIRHVLADTTRTPTDPS